jgi:peptidoglycan/xylan/chitin deacetylase (PgdA/CDA1 family)
MEIARCIRAKESFLTGAVAITFDDGFRNVYTVAYPILKQLGFTATVFLVPGYCGRTNLWNKPPEKIPEMDLLNWDEVLEMSENDIDFGAHTMTHPNLSDISLDRAIAEIREAKEAIQTKVGGSIETFAYPYGVKTQTVQEYVLGQFRAACSTRFEEVNLRSNVHSLPRIDMYYFSNNNLFRIFETPVYRHYLRWRGLLRSLRTRE